MRKAIVSLINVVRWAVFAPIAIALHQFVLNLYPPVGDFLGGYFGFWPWMYKVAALGFFFVAALLAVFTATVIAPSRQNAVGLIAGGATIAYACAGLLYFRNPAWPAWYCALYVACVCAGSAIGYLFAWGFVEVFEELEIGYWKSRPND